MLRFNLYYIYHLTKMIILFLNTYSDRVWFKRMFPITYPTPQIDYLDYIWSSIYLYRVNGFYIVITHNN